MLQYSTTIKSNNYFCDHTCVSIFPKLKLGTMYIFIGELKVLTLHDYTAKQDLSRNSGNLIKV